jgi:protocatechuate 3,4-dioxygenase beta subunit
VIATSERAEIAVAPASAKTDAGGQFRVGLRSPAPFTLRVEAPGLAAWTLRHQLAGSPIAVALARGTTIEGIVRETTSGAPVPEATVEAREETREGTGEETPGGGLAWDPDSGVVRARTDAKGAYRLEGLAPGFYTLSAVARGRGRADRRGAPAGRPADLLMMAGGAVSGTVTDARGKPVDGVALRLTAGGLLAREPVLAARTDPRGTFAIYGVPPGKWRIVGRHPDLAAAISAPVTVERDAEARADLVMSPPTTVRGRLIGPGAKPTRGHATLAKIGGVYAPEILAADLAAEAGGDGVFVLRAGPGSHSLEVKAPGLAARRLDVDVRGARETVDLGDVVLAEGIAIRGRVRDSANQPIENAKVSTDDEDNSFEERSDASGAYVLAGLPAGTYTVSVTAPGMGRVERQAKAGASGIDFVLQPAGRITGLVVDENGRPIEAFRVLVHNPDRRDLGRTTQDNFAATEGRFVVEDVGEGKYLLYVRAPDRADTVIAHVKVAAEGTTDVGTVRLVPGGIVRGVVVDASSAPVSGATAVVRVETPNYSRPSPEVTTDAEGAFEVRGVSPGTAQVTVTHPAFALGFASGMEVDPARGPVETRVVMSQGGRIEGQVRGVLPVGAFVDVRSLSPGADGVLRPMLPSQPVAPDGTFVVEHIPTGRIAVALLTRGERRYNSVAEVEAEVRESETTRVEIVLRHVAVGGAELLEGAASRRSSSRGARR